MNSIFLYLLKVIICSGILFSYYWLTLRDKKFHQYNRFYLLFSVVCSLLIPLVHLSWFTVREKTVNQFSIVRVLYEGELDPVVITSESISWQTISLYILLAISTILLFLLGLRILKVLKLARQYPKIELDGVDFLNTDIQNAPFSFLNYLFWKRNIDIQTPVGKQILEHELTHIRQKHTWDKLFLQIMAAIFWFNPFYWWMQKEITIIHEFLADEKAVGDQDIQSFARMLIEAHFGPQVLVPTHAFAYRPIKRRLKMLTSSSQTKYSYMRRLFLLPLLAAVMGLFAFTVKKQDWKVAETDLKAWAKYAGINLKDSHSNYSKSRVALSVKGSLPDSVIIIKNNNKRDTIVDISSQKLALLRGKSLGLKLSKDSSIVTHKKDAFSKFENQTFGKNKKPLLILDGKELGGDQSLSSLNPNQIESVSVFKDLSAYKLYGDKGKDGVIIVTTKKTTSLINSDTSRKVKDIIVKGYPKVKEQEADQENLNEVTVVGFSKQHQVKKQNVDQEPAFPGGAKAWRIFLMRNLRADVPTKNGAPANRNYTVIASFQVNKNGKLSHFKADNDPGYGTAKEVLRLIKGSPNWIPATKDGKPVAYRQRQQVTFQVTKE